MSSNLVETTIPSKHLRQAGLTGKNLQDYLNNKYTVDGYGASMMQNVYYITAPHGVKLVRFNSRTTVALKTSCLGLVLRLI